MKPSRTKKREISGSGSAPKSHRELVKEAKESKKKAPKDKYKCDVFFIVEDRMKKQYEIRKPTKHAMKVAQLKHTHRYSDRIVEFGEIKPIKLS